MTHPARYNGVANPKRTAAEAERMAKLVYAEQRGDWSTVAQLEAEMDEIASSMRESAGVLMPGELPARMKLKRLDTVQPERVTWLWENRIPCGKLTLLMGMGGEGKTWLALDMAARVSTGRAWPDAMDTPRKRGRVLILTSEDGLADTVRPRLDAHAADVSMIDAIEAVAEVDKSGDRSFDLQRDIALLDKTLSQLGDVSLIIFDALNSYMGGGHFDSHKDADVRRVLEPLCKLAERHSVAIIGIGHLSKQEHAKAMNKFCGSVAYGNIARAAWLVTRDPNDEDKRLFLNVKMNIAKPAPNLAFTITDGAVHWCAGTVDITADEAVASDGTDSEQRSKVAECAEFLRAMLLANGDTASGDLLKDAKAAGFDEKCVDRAKQRAKVESYMFNASFPPKWYMRLKDKPLTTPPVVPVPHVPLVPLALGGQQGQEGQQGHKSVYRESVPLANTNGGEH